MAKKTTERALAKELYFYTGKTQKEIAGIVGVSEKTLSDWAWEGDWEALKKAVELTPERVVQDLYKELEELNKLIQSREPGYRFADAKEADARRKIVSTIRDMHKQVSLPQFVQVIMGFMDYLLAQDLELAKQVNTYANDFLMEKSAITNR